MDHKIICKTMLYSYKDIIKLSEVIDERILKRAIRSASRNTYDAFDEMIDLINEKRAYCNVKVIIDEAFATMKNKTELEYYHLYGDDIKDIAIRFNVCDDTIHKRLERQRNNLYKVILSKYDTAKLFEIISDSRWLMNRYMEHKEFRKVKKERE